MGSVRSSTTSVRRGSADLWLSSAAVGCSGGPSAASWCWTAYSAGRLGADRRLAPCFGWCATAKMRLVLRQTRTRLEAGGRGTSPQNRALASRAIGMTPVAAPIRSVVRAEHFTCI